MGEQQVFVEYLVVVVYLVIYGGVGKFGVQFF